MKVVPYTRVSTEEQAESRLSLDAQWFSIQRACGLRDLPVPPRPYSDEGISAATLADRPGVQAALAALEPGDVFMVDRLDRLVRNAIEGLVLVRDYFSPRRRGQAAMHTLISLSEAIDTSTPAGRFSVGLHLLQGEYERDLIGDRTSKALKQLQRSGQAIGRVPYGWRRKDGVLTEDAEEQRLIGIVRRWKADGARIVTIAKELNAKGWVTDQGHPWTVQSVRRVLRATAPSPG